MKFNDLGTVLRILTKNKLCFFIVSEKKLKDETVIKERTNQFIFQLFLKKEY